MITYGIIAYTAIILLAVGYFLSLRYGRNQTTKGDIENGLNE
jgi:hypothetical protein